MPFTGAGRWARALSGQATTAPPRNAMSSCRLTRPPKSMQVQSIDFAGQLQSIAASQRAEAPDARCGSTPAVCNRLFDFESLSEPPRIPAMPSVDRANGALCQLETLMVGAAGRATAGKPTL